jgi:hypothetical protein
VAANFSDPCGKICLGWAKFSHVVLTGMVSAGSKLSALALRIVG